MTIDALTYLGTQEFNFVLALAVLFMVALFLMLLGVNFGTMSRMFQTSGMSTFFASQGPNILTLVVMFFTVIVLFKILGVDFNPKVNKHIAKVVTVESMTPMERGPQGICANTRELQPNYPFDEDSNVIHNDASYYEGKLHRD